MRRAPCIRPVQDWGAAHTRATRRLTGTITQATATRPDGQNDVRYGENERNRFSRSRGSPSVYALSDSFRPRFPLKFG